MPLNQLQQAAVTYLASRDLWRFGGVALFTMLTSIGLAQRNSPLPVVAMFFVAGFAGQAITAHAKAQFCHPRSRLFPCFAGPHIACLAIAALTCYCVYPLILSLAVGWNPLGAAAFIAAGAALYTWALHCRSWVIGAATLALAVAAPFSSSFWSLVDPPPATTAAHIAIFIAGWGLYAAWLWRLTTLHEDSSDYNAPVMLSAADDGRLGRGLLGNTSRRTAAPSSLSDRWHDSLSNIHASTATERRRLLRFGFAASPPLIQAIFLTSLFASMFYGIHYFFLSGKDAWPTILPSLGMITLYPSLNALGLLPTRRPRIAQELLLPLTRRDYVDGLLVAGARRVAAMAICSTLACLGLLAVASPQLISVRFVLLYVFLAFTLQLWAFGAYAYTAHRPTGLRVLIMVGIIIPVAFATFWGLRSAADGPVPTIPRPDFASMPTLPPEAHARLEALHQKQTAEIRERLRAQPDRSLVVAAAVGLGGVALIAHSRRRWMHVEFGAPLA